MISGIEVILFICHYVGRDKRHVALRPVPPLIIKILAFVRVITALRRVNAECWGSVHVSYRKSSSPAL